MVCIPLCCNLLLADIIPQIVGGVWGEEVWFLRRHPWGGGGVYGGGHGRAVVVHVLGDSWWLWTEDRDVNLGECGFLALAPPHRERRMSWH